MCLRENEVRVVFSLPFFSLRKLDMVGTWSNVGKRAKRMPVITVQTTIGQCKNGSVARKQ